MFSKKLTLPLIFSCFLIISCSSLDIQQNETDLYQERLKADGKEARKSTPLVDFFPDIFGNDYASTINSITFEVALNKLYIDLTKKNKTQQCVISKKSIEGQQKQVHFLF